jgi:hypothetical protein
MFVSPVFDKLKGPWLLHNDIILPFRSERRFGEDDEGELQCHIRN